MNEQTASVMWNGAGRHGTGLISTGAGALMDYPYGFDSRFGDERRGTNPEELLGAAHAASFTMAFAFACEKAGFVTQALDTRVKVRLAAQGEGLVIDRIALALEAQVPGLDDARLQQLARAALRDCPLCTALAGVGKITLQARLIAPTVPTLTAGTRG